MKKFLFFLASFSFFGSFATAQTEAGDDTFLNLYKNQLPYFQELISGGEYGDSPRSIDGEPYYKSRNFDYGSLRINQVNYQEVPLLYDSFKDLVVTFHPIHKQKILIKSEKVDQFVIFEVDVFRNFPGNERYGKNGNGFYRVNHDGEIKVLTKYFKTLKESKDILNYLQEFSENEDYFLWYDGDFAKINRRKEALKVLGLEKKTVKKSVPMSNYEFNQDVIGSLTRLVKFREESLDTFTGFDR